MVRQKAVKFPWEEAAIGISIMPVILGCLSGCVWGQFVPKVWELGQFPCCGAGPTPSWMENSLTLMVASMSHQLHGEKAAWFQWQEESCYVALRLLSILCHFLVMHGENRSRGRLVRKKLGLSLMLEMSLAKSFIECSLLNSWRWEWMMCNLGRSFFLPNPGLLNIW